MCKLNMCTDTKKALFVNNERITDYIFDDIWENDTEIILYSDSIVNIYDKMTGEKIFERVLKDGEFFRFIMDFFYIEKNDKVWLYTTRGKKFSKRSFDDISIQENYESLKLIIVHRGNKQGVYSFAGDKLVACEYDGIKLRKNAIEAHYMEGNHIIVHLYSLKGLLIFPAILHEDQWLSTPAGIIKKNPKGKKGLYSIDGKVILSEIYDEIEVSDMYDFHKRECIVVKKDDKYGVVNFFGKEILPIEFDDARICDGIPHSERDFILVKKDNKYGIFSSDGRLQVPIEYDYFKSYFKDRTCNACKDGTWGFYIIPKKQFVIADDINITKTDKYEIFVNGKWQMIKLI